jgi:hypothetical protein
MMPELCTKLVFPDVVIRETKIQVLVVKPPPYIREGAGFKAELEMKPSIRVL